MKKKEIVVLSFTVFTAVAAGLYMTLKRRNRKEERTPKDAPQLDIENPGEQSEFLSAPSDERDLG